MHMIGSNLEHLAVESPGGFAFLLPEKELMRKGRSTLERCSSHSECLSHKHSKLVLLFQAAEVAQVGIQAKPQVSDVY